MLILENKRWIVKIKSKGAEIQSMREKLSDRELIWQGNSNYWNRRAPILFPSIGGLKDNKYHINGKEYTMGKHGFCRDAQFQLIQHTATELVLQYNENKETLAQYPFEFTFQVIFELKEDKLINRFKIFNKSKKTMWFCLGGHPAFNLPMKKNLKFEDYHLRFEYNETAPLYYLKEDLLAGKKDNWLNNSNKIRLNSSLFDNDALIFHRLKSKKIFIESDQDNQKVEFDLGSFPMVGIWTKEGGAPFLCVEPWYGVDDAIDSDGDFTKKWEAVSLNRNEEFEAWFSMGCF